LAKQSQFIPLQNVVYFTTLPFLVRKIFTFYINYVLFKCQIPGPKGYSVTLFLLPFSNNTHIIITTKNTFGVIHRLL